MKQRAILVAAALAGASLAACQLILGVEDEGFVEPGPADANVPAPASDAGDAGTRTPTLALCPRSNDPLAPDTLPGNPGTDDTALEPKDFRFFAVRSIHLTDQNGLDLDGRYSGVDGGQAPVCGTATKDGVGGLDNGLGAMLKSIAFLAGDDPLAAELNPELDAGLTGLIFEVANYNGSDNDHEVGLGLQASPGIKSNDGGGTDPTWDGHGKWPYSGSSARINNGGFTDGVQQGYVADKTFVARELDDTKELRVPFFGVSLGMLRSTFVAHLDTPNGVPVLQGYVTGIVDPYTLYAAFHSARVTLGGTGDASNAQRLCKTTLAKTTCEKLVEYSDLPMCLDGQLQGAQLPCGMISLAIGFEAYQIDDLGDYVPPAPLDDGDCPAFDAAARQCPDAPAP